VSLVRLRLFFVASRSLTFSFRFSSSGYLTFGSKVGSNIIAMYPNSSLFVAIGRLGIVLMVLFSFVPSLSPSLRLPSTPLLSLSHFSLTLSFPKLTLLRRFALRRLSYPLQAHPCRLALDKVISTIKSYSSLHLDHHGHKAAATAPTPVSAVESLNDDDDDEEAEEDFIPEELVKEMSQTRYIALTVGILLGGLVIALLVDDLEIGELDVLPWIDLVAFRSFSLADLFVPASTVLSFVGATGSTTISFILPGLFYFSLFRKVEGTSPLLKWGSAALAIYGICVMCFCLTYVPPLFFFFPLFSLADPVCVDGGR